MAAATYDITIEQGATFIRVINVTEGSGAKDLTGYVARSMVRRKYSATSPLATFTAVITNPSGGEITLTLSATDTAALPTGVGVWDLELEKLSVVTRLLQGTVTITPEATK